MKAQTVHREHAQMRFPPTDFLFAHTQAWAVPGGWDFFPEPFTEEANNRPGGVGLVSRAGEKRTRVSEVDKGKIVMARQMDVSVSETAKLVGCSWEGVVNTCRDWGERVLETTRGRVHYRILNIQDQETQKQRRRLQRRRKQEVLLVRKREHQDALWENGGGRNMLLT